MGSALVSFGLRLTQYEFFSWQGSMQFSNPFNPIHEWVMSEEEKSKKDGFLHMWTFICLQVTIYSLVSLYSRYS